MEPAIGNLWAEGKCTFREEMGATTPDQKTQAFLSLPFQGEWCLVLYVRKF